MLNHDLEECKDKIRDFIMEKLGNKIENLREFDFQLMIDNPQNYYWYCGSSDCDNTELAKAIYCVLWHDKINELSPKTIGTGQCFRGDCINTLAVAISKRTVDKLCKQSNNEDILVGGSIQISKESELAKKINKMILLYHTYGNFICLPNNCGEIVIDRGGSNTKKETFNTYRGSYTKVLKYPQYNNSHWGKVTYADNFYIFLKELDICFENIFNNINNEVDEYLLDIFNKNKDFFKLLKDKYGNPDFECFYDLYYLDKDYINKKGNGFELLRWGELSKNKITDEKYIELLEKYLDYSIKFISDRTKLMECKLKKELEIK